MPPIPSTPEQPDFVDLAKVYGGRVLDITEALTIRDPKSRIVWRPQGLECAVLQEGDQHESA